MRVTRYVSDQAIEDIKEEEHGGGSFRALGIRKDACFHNEITIIIPDPPIEMTVWRGKNEAGDRCECLRRAPIGQCKIDYNCTKYTGTLNPVTP